MYVSCISLLVQLEDFSGFLVVAGVVECVVGVVVDVAGFVYFGFVVGSTINEHFNVN